MSLLLSPRVFRQTLKQSTLGKDLRRGLVDAFVLGGEGWALLAFAGKKKPCLPTRDPILLALRRLAWPEVGELHAMHRLAVFEAKERPHGFLHLVLEEAVALEHPAGLPAVQDDEALKAFFSLVPEIGKPPHAAELKELRSRGLIYVTRRLFALGDDFYTHFLPFVYFRVGEKPLDPELDLFLAETMAMVLEREGKAQVALGILLPAVHALLEGESPAGRLYDRSAESLVFAADMMRRHGLTPEDARKCDQMALALLHQVSPSFNLPLRRRLAEER